MRLHPVPGNKAIPDSSPLFQAGPDLNFRRTFYPDPTPNRRF